MQAGVPIIPVTINGAYDIWPPGQKLPLLTGKVTIYFHPPKKKTMSPPPPSPIVFT